MNRIVSRISVVAVRVVLGGMFVFSGMNKLFVPLALVVLALAWVFRDAFAPLLRPRSSRLPAPEEFHRSELVTAS